MKNKKNFLTIFLIIFFSIILLIVFFNWLYENNALQYFIWFVVIINFMVSLGCIKTSKLYFIISLLILVLLIGLSIYNESKWHYTGLLCDGTGAKTWGMTCVEYANFVCKEVCSPRDYTFKLPCNMIDCYCKDGWLDWVEGSIC